MALTDNFIHAWQFEDNFNDTKGSNDGTGQGSYSFVSAKYNKGVELDGTDGNGAEVSDIGDLSPFSISVWAKSPNTTAQQQIFTDYYYDGSSSSKQIVLKFYSGNIDCYIFDSSHTLLRINSFSYSANTWYHIVVTYDGTNLTQYVDNNVKGTDTGSGIQSNSNPYYIGCADNQGDYYNVFDGIIDELYVWDRELSSAEVSDLYNSGTGKFWNGSSFIVPSTNTAPNAPSNPSPSDASTGISTSPTLFVDVSDPDGDSMDVSFYDASDDSQIGSTQTGISDGGTASVTWSSLSEGTSYSWYAIADDGTDTTQSSTWNFTTLTSEQITDGIKIMQSGSFVTPSDIKIMQSGNFVNLSDIKVMKNGSWQDL